MQSVMARDVSLSGVGSADALSELAYGISFVKWHPSGRVFGAIGSSGRDRAWVRVCGVRVRIGVREKRS